MPEDPDEPFESESSFIRFLTQRCTSLDMTSDFTDDCAWIKQHTDLLSTDTIIAGIHFDHRWATPNQIGRQAAVVSLSDLAASGAGPSWVMLSLEIPVGWFGNRLRSLCDGFLSVLSMHNVSLVGGNCAHSTGPLSITVTVGGQLFTEQPITRSHAQNGDSLCVSGVLGAAALGVLKPSATHTAIRHRWRPHFDESQTLMAAGVPSAMMDISDGLVVDSSRIAHASGIDIHIDTHLLPLLPHSETYTRVEALDFALYGGEDYVLLFTCSSETKLPPWAVVIGAVKTGQGIVFIDGKAAKKRGFDHFQAEDDVTS